MKSAACLFSSEGGTVLQCVGQARTSQGRSPCVWTHSCTFAPTSPGPPCAWTHSRTFASTSPPSVVGKAWGGGETAARSTYLPAAE
ncbi:hypothetical protein CDAR_279691 [Caerostris darwini]|uniref:Uncharacterized protein n=1 Tax=Caerostris darwini TaxID=1538125 RepID=A0AAV4PTW8_9ARAC|nr:hypothetical protein CDAR_279691 [Caerostris darwini]